MKIHRNNRPPQSIPRFLPRQRGPRPAGGPSPQGRVRHPGGRPGPAHPRPHRGQEPPDPVGEELRGRGQPAAQRGREHQRHAQGPARRLLPAGPPRAQGVNCAASVARITPACDDINIHNTYVPL